MWSFKRYVCVGCTAAAGIRPTQQGSHHSTPFHPPPTHTSSQPAGRCVSSVIIPSWGPVSARSMGGSHASTPRASRSCRSLWQLYPAASSTTPKRKLQPRVTRQTTPAVTAPAGLTAPRWKASAAGGDNSGGSSGRHAWRYTASSSERHACMALHSIGQTGPQE